MIVFEEIFVGERNRTMDVLSSSLPSSVSQSIASLLDLPGQPPAGFGVEPFIFGAPTDEFYILARLGPDPSATRSGMVFAHALVAKRSAISELKNVSSVFEHLSSAKPTIIDAQQRSLSLGASAVLPPPGTFCDIIVNRSVGPAVTSNPSRMQDFIIRLWPRLFPKMRAELRFGLAFALDEANIMNLDIALVPSQALIQWPRSCRIDDLSIEASATTAGGRALSGDDYGALKDFAQALSLENIGLTGFERLSQAYGYYSQKPHTFDSTLVGLRLITALQPNQLEGLPIKKELVARLLGNQRPCSGQEILALRNLDFEAIIDDAEAVVTALRNTAKEVLKTSMTTGNVVAFIDAAVSDSGATKVWQKAAREFLAAPSECAADVLSVGLIALFTQDAHKSVYAIKFMAREHIDPVLAERIESTKTVISDEVHRTLSAAGYPLSDTAILLVKSDGELSLALKMACMRDRKIYETGPIAALLSRMTPEQRVLSAIEISDPVVTKAAAECVSVKPLLLQDHPLAAHPVQEVWGEALRLSDTAYGVRPTMRSVQNEIFTLLEARNIDAGLVTQLMRTPIGNWIEYPNRANLWSLLSGPARNHALTRTAAGWIVKYNEQSVDLTDNSLEVELGQELADQTQASELIKALRARGLSRAVNVFVANRHLGSDLFFEILMPGGHLTNEMDNGLAERTARLVMARGWRSITRRLHHHVGVTSLLRPYFVVCAEHLTFWERLTCSVHKPTGFELFDLLLDVASELYREGLLEREIWSRAGGDPSMMKLNGTGNDQWRYAILQIRNGGSHVEAKNLIMAMSEDFPNNARLSQLSREFR